MNCRHVEQGAHRTKTDKAGAAYHVHRLNGTPRPASSLPPMAAATGVNRADDDTLHAVYSALVAAFPLSAIHRGNLKDRGMQDVDIDQRGYGTLTKEGRSRVALALRDRFGDVVLRVPGFFVKEGERGHYLTLAGRPGLLIPVRDLTGKVMALRIRPDDRKPNEPKYVWLSSGSRGGATPGAQVHCPKSIALQTKTVRITEGELKADIATLRSGMLTLSIPGVGCWRPAIDMLKRLECDVVRLAIDMDARENPHVARALDELAFGLVEAGFTLELETWDRQFKGIDDALVGGATIEVAPPALAREKIAEIVTAGAGDGGPPKITRGDSWEGDDDDRNEVYLPEWKPFPIDTLPFTLRDFALDYARSLECDPAILALFSLGALAGCIGGARVIRLTQTWYEPCAIFGCVIGVSCSKKSLALREAMAPVEAFDEELYARSQEDFAAFDEQVEAYAAWKPGMSSMEKPGKPIEPIDRQLIAQDITIEAVIRRMQKNQRGLLFPFEELRQWFLGMGRYAKNGAGGGVEECIWINIFDGVNYHLARTKDRQRVRLRVLGSVIGGTQPMLWDQLAGPVAFASGMMGRILPIWPNKVEQTGVYVAPTLDVTRRYHELVRAVALADREATDCRNYKPVEMILTPHAQQVWNEWGRAWGHKIDDADGEIHTLLARMKTYCARFALIMSVCDAVESHGPNVVEAEHIRNAIKMAHWFAEESERIYARRGLNVMDTKRADVLQKLRDRVGPKISKDRWYSLTARELWSSNRGKWGDSNKARVFLETLIANADKTPGPVIRVGKRYFLRAKR